MIDVLLATYRPNSQWLKEQVDSILNQQGVKVNLIHHEDTEGLGACGNFGRLLEESSSEYVAFADQDDVWFDDKLATAMSKMRELESRWGKSTPLLVFADARVADAELNVVGDSLFAWTKVDPTRLKPNQLVFQNVANGNTMLINAALRDLALPIPKAAFMHDAWLMLVAAAFGQIAWVKKPCLLYRQHNRNTIGGAKVGLRYFATRLMSGRSALKQRFYANVRQAEAFNLRFGERTPVALRALAGLQHRPYLVRVWILLRHRIFKCGLLRNIGTFLIV